MMLFGRTLFGGAGTGIVIGAGAALCAAVAQGDAQVSYSARTSAVASAQAYGVALRSAVAAGSLRADALAVGHPLGRFAAGGLGGALAYAGALPTSYLYVSGHAVGDASVRALARRQIRMRLQPPARAYAYAEADGVFYAYAYGKRAVARAFAFGTTYQVAHGSAYAGAAATGAPEWIIGAKQNAIASADGSAHAHVEAGAIGFGVARAYGIADAAVRRDGVLFYECFGDAKVSALGRVDTVSVYQAQIAMAFAYASALPIHTRGFKGRGTAYAAARGDGVIIQTGVSGSPAIVVATATAQGVRWVSGTALSHADAELVGAATAYLNCQGRAVADAALADRGTAYGVTGRGVASANAAANGVRGVAATPALAIATATATGFNQINDLNRAPGARTVVVAPSNRVMRASVSVRLMRVAA